MRPDRRFRAALKEPANDPPYFSTVPDRQRQRPLDAFLAEVVGLPELERKRQEPDRRVTLLAQQLYGGGQVGLDRR